MNGRKGPSATSFGSQSNDGAAQFRADRSGLCTISRRGIGGPRRSRKAHTFESIRSDGAVLTAIAHPKSQLPVSYCGEMLCLACSCMPPVCMSSYVIHRMTYKPMVVKLIYHDLKGMVESVLHAKGH